MPQRGFNIGDLLQVLSAGGGAAYETDIFNRQQKQQQGIRLYDILQEQEGQAHQRRRQAKSDRLSQGYFDIAQDKAAVETPETLTQMKARVLRGVEEGTMSPGMPIVDLLFGGQGKPDRPPDFAGKFRNLMRQEQADWAKYGPYERDAAGDIRVADDKEVRAPFPEQEKRRGIFDTNIASQAMQYGLNVDSLENLLKIDPVTGAMDIPQMQQSLGPRALPSIEELRTGRFGGDPQLNPADFQAAIQSTGKQSKRATTEYMNSLIGNYKSSQRFPSDMSEREQAQASIQWLSQNLSDWDQLTPKQKVEAMNSWIEENQ